MWRREAEVRQVRSELQNVFMGSTFSELFYFYFRERCRNREVRGRGMGKLKSFYLFIYLCK